MEEMKEQRPETAGKAGESYAAAALRRNPVEGDVVTLDADGRRIPLSTHPDQYSSLIRDCFDVGHVPPPPPTPES